MRNTEYGIRNAEYGRVKTEVYDFGFSVPFLSSVFRIPYSVFPASYSPFRAFVFRIPHSAFRIG